MHQIHSLKIFELCFRWENQTLFRSDIRGVVTVKHLSCHFGNGYCLETEIDSGLFYNICTSGLLLLHNRVLRKVIFMCFPYIQSISENADPLEPGQPVQHGVQIHQEATEYLPFKQEVS